MIGTRGQLARRAACTATTAAAALPALASTAHANAAGCTYPTGNPLTSQADICMGLRTDTPKGGNFVNEFTVSKGTTRPALEYYIIGLNSKGTLRWMSPKRVVDGFDPVCTELLGGVQFGSTFKTPCHQWPGGGAVSYIGLIYGRPGDVTHFSRQFEIKSK